MPAKDTSAITKSTPATSVIFRCLYDARRAMTKQEVADACGLSLPTVYQGFATLDEQGLIEVGGDRSSTGGRRAQTFAVASEGSAAVGISLTGHSARCIACDLYGERIAGLYIKQPLPGECTAESLTAAIEDIAGAMEVELKQRKIRPIGIGIAVPSALDPQMGKLLNTSVLRLGDAELYAHDLTRRLAFPAGVFNDANCGGFSQVFPNSEDTSLAYLSLERGVGGALIINGKPFEGPRGTSGEFGHICIVPGGKKCACGQNGCLEAYCSSNVLSEEQGMTLDEFFADAERGVEPAKSVLDEYIGHLARGIQAIHTTLGCDVCLGGELSGYLVPFFGEIQAAVEAINPFPDGEPCAVHARHPFHGVPIGAAQLMIQRFIESV
ncbi:ROK family transcriptional regulator [Paratractidigestivibacter sp.]|uniref:ROK family transcriptional regulator n=1 Tax=Paratractidigestivibacter sp. TaxID=2847316 RepID=UPI002AC925ED|nr:ROK family transcriptional regulator [Paratractidigestivibacter sp.]